MNEDLARPAHQEELTLYNKDKAFSITQKPQGPTAYYRNTAEEIRDFVRWKESKVCKATQLLCGLKIVLASSYSVVNLSMYIKI